MITPTWDSEYTDITDSGWQDPNAVVDDASIGTVAWSNPTNAKTSNDAYATAVLGSFAISHYLKATDFHWTPLAPNQVVLGIEIRIERKSVLAGAADYEVRLVKSDGSLCSTNLKLSPGYTNTDTYVTYGGSTNLCGYTDIAYTDVNDSDFGVVLSCQADPFGQTVYVDHIQVKIHYGTLGTGPSCKQYHGGGAPLYELGDPPGITVIGNIDLNNRVILAPDTPSSTIILTWLDGWGDLYVILSTVWLVDGVATVLSVEDATTKFEVDGLHLGAFLYQIDAIAYAAVLQADQLTRYQAYPVVCLHGHPTTYNYRVQYPYRSFDVTSTTTGDWASSFYTDHNGDTQYIELQLRDAGMVYTWDAGFLVSFNDDPHGDSLYPGPSMPPSPGTGDYLYHMTGRSVYIQHLGITHSTGSARFFPFTPDPVTDAAPTPAHDQYPVLFMRDPGTGVLSATVPMWEWLNVGGVNQWVNTGNATVSHAP